MPSPDYGRPFATNPWCPAHSDDGIVAGVRTNRRLLGLPPQPCTCATSSAGPVIRQISDLIDESYPADTSTETVLWRRCSKIGEEYGEVVQAIIGVVGENPRKGFTHTMDQVEAELLDVALAALAAFAHVCHDEDPIAALSVWAESRLQRLRAVTPTPPGADHA